MWHNLVCTSQRHKSVLHSCCHKSYHIYTYIYKLTITNHCNKRFKFDWVDLCVLYSMGLFPWLENKIGCKIQEKLYEALEIEENLYEPP